MTHRLQFTPRRQASPVSFWVHHPADKARAGTFIRARHHQPPMPPAVPGRGYPHLVVPVGGTELCFASAAEVEHVIEVLSQKHLPTTRALSAKRSPAAGPNSHWLSRLPAALKPWAKRRRIVRALERALQEVRKSKVTF